MVNWNTFVDINIHKRIFHLKESFPPLLCVIALNPFTNMLRKITSRYSIKNKPKNNHFLYSNDLMIYVKNRRELEPLIMKIRIFSDKMMREFGEKCAINNIIM